MPEKQTKRIHISEDEAPLASAEVRQWWKDMMSLFAGGPAVVSIEKPKRSLDQNSYYWGVVLPTVRDGLHDAGMTELHLVGPGGEQIDLPLSVHFLHRWFKNKYLTPEAEGKEPTTTTLDTTQFSDYVEAIKTDDMVRRLDIYIPSPGQAPMQAYD
jgi:hypothetical protein